MSQGMYTLVCLGLAAIAYFIAGVVPAGSSHDGLIAVAGALLTLQMRPRGEPGRKSIPPVAIVFAVLLAVGPGCASFYGETNDAINTTAAKISEAKPAIDLLCQADPGPRCDDAHKTYEVADAAVEAAHAANEVVRLAKAGYDELGKALKELADAAAEVARVATAD